MKRILFIIFSLILCSCWQYNVIRENNLNMMNLTTGMNKTEVLEIMGGVKTFRLTELKTVTNPYKTELTTDTDGNVYEFIWYITEVPNFIYDGTVKDEDLTPFAFINGELHGWGWNFYFEAKKRYQIDLDVDIKN